MPHTTESCTLSTSLCRMAFAVSAEHREYTGPPPRRWAPWIFAALLAIAIVAAVVDDDGNPPLAGPLALLVGATMFGQLVGALRTGTLFGIFSASWPPHVTRRSYPVIFWFGVVLYAVVGLVFLVLGVVGIRAALANA
jgi:peptidoglycan/LPS O-acetylase OafA/YrhL